MTGSWRRNLYRRPLVVTALRGSDFGMAISDTLDRTYVPHSGLQHLRRKRNVFLDAGGRGFAAP